MPLCTVDTNLKKDEIPSEFHVKLLKVLSEILKKPVDRVTVVVRPDMLCTRGGKVGPNAFIQIWSINVFNEGSNPAFGQKLVKFFKSELPIIPENMLAFCFHPIAPHDVYSGS